jgi:hypothetical protein
MALPWLGSRANWRRSTKDGGVVGAGSGFGMVWAFDGRVVA